MLMLSPSLSTRAPFSTPTPPVSTPATPFSTPLPAPSSPLLVSSPLVSVTMMRRRVMVSATLGLM